MKNLTASAFGLFRTLRNMNRGSALAIVACTALSSVPVAAAPAPGPELQKWREVLRFEPKAAYGGAARVNVDAPHELVRSVVLDYKNYAKFISRFETAKVIGKKGNTTDVYLKVPILNGAGSVWAIVRFEPMTTVDGVDTLVGHKLEEKEDGKKTGNVKRLDATWRLTKLDDSTTQVELELVIVPGLPVPKGVVESEVRFAAAKAVEGSRNEAEKRRAQ
jgi:ribosome-associated toxin RatA of RatAB toxin-antitoxin module